MALLEEMVNSIYTLAVILLLLLAICIFADAHFRFLCYKTQATDIVYNIGDASISYTCPTMKGDEDEQT